MPLSDHTRAILDAMMNGDKKREEELANLRMRLAMTNAKIETLQKHRSAILRQIRKVFRPYSIEQPKDNDLVSTYLRMLMDEEGIVRSDMTLGDAMEKIIKEHGPQSQKDLIERIRAAGIRLSERNPYISLGAAIRNDAKKRFVRVEGRVALRKENEQADAKS